MPQRAPNAPAIAEKQPVVGPTLNNAEPLAPSPLTELAIANQAPQAPMEVQSSEPLAPQAPMEVQPSEPLAPRTLFAAIAARNAAPIAPVLAPAPSLVRTRIRVPRSVSFQREPLVRPPTGAIQPPQLKNFTFVRGSLLKAPLSQLIVHSIGCDNSLGAGIAKTIESVFRVRQHLPRNAPLGSCVIVHKERMIANLYTKVISSSRPNTLPAFFAALKNLRNLVSPTQPLAFPKIECGLNGQKWENVQFLLALVFPFNPIFIYSLENDPELFQPEILPPPTTVAGATLNLFDGSDCVPRRVLTPVPKPTVETFQKAKKTVKPSKIPTFSEFKRTLSEPVEVNFVYKHVGKIQKHRTRVPPDHLCNKICAKKHNFLNMPDLPPKKKFLLRHAIHKINKCLVAVQESDIPSPIKTLVTSQLKEWLKNSFAFNTYDLVQGTTSIGIITLALTNFFLTEKKSIMATSITQVILALINIVAQVLNKKSQAKISEQQIEIIAESIEKAIQTEFKEQLPFDTDPTSSHIYEVTQDHTICLANGIKLVEAIKKKIPEIKDEVLNNISPPITLPHSTYHTPKDIGTPYYQAFDSITTPPTDQEQPEQQLLEVPPIINEDAGPEMQASPILQDHPFKCCAYYNYTDLVYAITEGKVILNYDKVTGLCLLKFECGHTNYTPFQIDFLHFMDLCEYSNSVDPHPETYASILELKCPHVQDINHFAHLVHNHGSLLGETYVTLPDSKKNFTGYSYMCLCEERQPLPFKFTPDNLPTIKVMLEEEKAYYDQAPPEEKKELKGCLKVWYKLLRQVSIIPEKVEPQPLPPISKSDLEYDDLLVADREAFKSEWISKAISYVVMALGGVLIAGASRFTTWFKDLNQALVFFKNITTVNESEMFKSIETFVSEQIFNEQDPTTATRANIVSKIEELNTFIGKPFDVMTDDYNFPSKFTNCIEEARKMFKDYSHMKQFTSCCVALNRKIETADLRLNDVKQAWRSLGTRQVPAAWMVYGKQGIGKSEANKKIAQDICNKFYKNETPFIIDPTAKYYSLYAGQHVTLIEECCNKKDLRDDKIALSLNTAIGSGAWNLEGAFVKDMYCRSTYLGADTNKDPLEFLAALPVTGEAAAGTVNRFTWFEAYWNTKYPRPADRNSGHRDDYDHIRYRPVRLSPDRNSLVYYSVKIGENLFDSLTVSQLTEYVISEEKKRAEDFKKRHSDVERLRALDLESKNRIATRQASFIRTVLLYGQPGEGKTNFVLPAILNQLAEDYPVPVIKVEPTPEKDALQTLQSFVSPSRPTIFVLDDLLTEASLEKHGDDLEMALMSFYNNLPPSSVIILLTNVIPKPVGRTIPSLEPRDVCGGVKLPMPVTETVYENIFKNSGLYRRLGYNGWYLNKKSYSWSPMFFSSLLTRSINTTCYKIVSEKAITPSGEEVSPNILANMVSEVISNDYNLTTNVQIKYGYAVPQIPFEVNLNFGTWEEFKRFFTVSIKETLIWTSKHINITMNAIEKCAQIRFVDVRYDIPEKPSIEACTDVLLYFMRVLHRYNINLPIKIHIDEIGDAWFDGVSYYLTMRALSPLVEEKYSVAYDNVSKEVCIYTLEKGILYKLGIGIYYALFESKREDKPLDEFLRIPKNYRRIYEAYTNHPQCMIDDLHEQRKTDIAQQRKANFVGNLNSCLDFVTKYKWYISAMFALVPLITGIALLCNSPSKFNHAKVRNYYTHKLLGDVVPDEDIEYFNDLSEETKRANRDTISSIEREVALIRIERNRNAVPVIHKAEPEPKPDNIDFMNDLLKTIKELPTDNKDPNLLENVVKKCFELNAQSEKKKQSDDPRSPEEQDVNQTDMFQPVGDRTFIKDKHLEDKDMYPAGKDWADIFEEKTAKPETVIDADWNKGPKFAPEERYELIRRNVGKITTGYGTCFCIGYYEDICITVGHMAIKNSVKVDTGIIELKEVGIVDVDLLWVNAQRDISIWKARKPCFADKRKWFMPSIKELANGDKVPVTLCRQDGTKMNFVTGSVVIFHKDVTYEVDNEPVQYRDLVINSFLDTTHELATTNGDCGQIYVNNTARQGTPFIYGIHSLALRSVKQTGASVVTREIIDAVLRAKLPSYNPVAVTYTNPEPVIVKTAPTEEAKCIMCHDKCEGEKITTSNLAEGLIARTSTHKHYEGVDQLIVYDPSNHNDLQGFIAKVFTTQPRYPFYLNYGSHEGGTVDHPHIHFYSKLPLSEYKQVALFMKFMNISTLDSKSQPLISEGEVFFLLSYNELLEKLKPRKNNLQIYAVPYNNKLFGVFFKAGKPNTALFRAKKIEYTVCPLAEHNPCINYETDIPKKRSMVEVVTFGDHVHFIPQEGDVDIPSGSRQNLRNVTNGPYIVKEGMIHRIQGTRQNQSAYIRKMQDHLIEANEQLLRGKIPIYYPKTENCALLGTSTTRYIPPRHQYVATPFGAIAGKHGFTCDKQNVKFYEELTPTELWQLTPDSYGVPNQIIHQLAMTDIEKPCLEEEFIENLSSQMAEEMYVKYGKTLTFSSDEEVLSGSLSNRCPRTIKNYPPLNTDASGGYALDYLYGLKKKSDVIHTCESGIRMWKQKCWKADEVRKAYNVGKLMLKNGERPPVIFNTCLKEELLPCAKAWKGRVFEAEDLLGVLLERFVLGRYLGAKSVFDIEEQCAVGIDAAKDFHELFQKHKVFKNHFAGDFSRWDKRVSKDLVEILKRTIRKAHNKQFHQGADCTCGWVPAMETIFESCFVSIRFVHNSFYLVIGMASGTSLTAPMNSELVLTLLYAAWVRLTQIWDFKEFLENVIVSTYGDDTFISVSDKYIQIYNLETLIPIVFEISGAVLDSDTKDGNIVPYRHNLEELTFISRSPRLQPSGIIAGALKKITIEAWIFWVRKQPTDSRTNEVISSNLSSALFEASAWEKEYFQRIYQTVFDICESYEHIRKNIRMYTYDEYQNIRLRIVEGLRLGAAFLRECNFNDLLKCEKESLTPLQTMETCPEFNIVKQLAEQMGASVVVHMLNKLSILLVIVHPDHITETYISEPGSENPYHSVAMQAISGLQSHSYSKQLATETLKVQNSIAVKTQEALRVDKIYVFDVVGFFDNAQSKTVNNFRYLEKEGKVAVLSQAAQKVIRGADPANTYNQILTQILNVDEIGCYVERKSIGKDQKETILVAHREMMPAAPPVLPSVTGQTVPKLDPIVPLPPTATLDENASQAIKVFDEPQKMWVPGTFKWDAYTAFLNGIYTLDEIKITTASTTALLKSYSSKALLISALETYRQNHGYSVFGQNILIDVISPTGTKGRIGYAVVPGHFTPSSWTDVIEQYPFTELSLDGDSSSSVVIRNFTNKGMAIHNTNESTTWQDEKLLIFLTAPVSSTYNATATDLLVTLRTRVKLTPDTEFSMPKTTLSKIWAVKNDYPLNYKTLPTQSPTDILRDSSVSLIVTDNLHTQTRGQILYRTPIWAEFEPSSNNRFSFSDIFGYIALGTGLSTKVQSSPIPIFFSGDVTDSLATELNRQLGIYDTPTKYDIEIAILNALSNTYGNAVTFNVLENSTMPDTYRIQAAFPFERLTSLNQPEFGNFNIDIEIEPNLKFFSGYGYGGKIIMAIDIPELEYSDAKMWVRKSPLPDFDCDLIEADRGMVNAHFRGTYPYFPSCTQIGVYKTGIDIDWNLREVIVTGTLFNVPVITTDDDSGKRFYPAEDLINFIQPMRSESAWKNFFGINGIQITSWMSTTTSARNYNSFVFGHSNQSTLLNSGECAMPSDFHYRVMTNLEKQFSSTTILDLLLQGSRIASLMFVPGSGLFMNSLDHMRILPNISISDIDLRNAATNDLPTSLLENWQPFVSTATQRRFLKAAQEMWASAAAGAGSGLFQGIGNYFEQQQNFDRQQQLLDMKGKQQMNQIVAQGQNQLNLAFSQNGYALQQDKQHMELAGDNQIELANTQGDISLRNKLRLAGLTSAANAASGRAVATTSKVSGTTGDGSET